MQVAIPIKNRYLFRSNVGNGRKPVWFLLFVYLLFAIFKIKNYNFAVRKFDSHGSHDKAEKGSIELFTYPLLQKLFPKGKGIVSSCDPFTMAPDLMT